MKKVTLTALMFIAMIHAHSVFAGQPKTPRVNEKVYITANPTEQKKVVIRVINSAKNQTAFLRIKDAKGHILHTETIHHSPLFIRAYDFSQTPGETYTVEVRTRGGVNTHTFEVKDEAAQATYFKPVVKAESGLISVVFKNPLPSPLFLNLYDKTGKVVYKTKVPSQEIFSAGLDVSLLPKQPYSLRLWGNKYSYAKNISLQ